MVARLGDNDVLPQGLGMPRRNFGEVGCEEKSDEVSGRGWSRELCGQLEYCQEVSMYGSRSWSVLDSPCACPESSIL